MLGEPRGLFALLLAQFLDHLMLGIHFFLSIFEAQWLFDRHESSPCGIGLRSSDVVLNDERMAI